MFPPTSLSIAEEVLHAVPGLVVEVTVILCTSSSRVAVSSSDLLFCSLNLFYCLIDWLAELLRSYSATESFS